MGGDARTAGVEKQTLGDARSTLEILPPAGLRCLSLLSDLPLIAAAPLSLVLGLTQQHTYTLLDQLGASGLVTGVRVAVAERSAPKLYHISDLGLSALSLARGTDPRSLALRKKLAREHLLAALPGVALLAADYELLGAVAGWRSGPVSLLRYERPWRAPYARRGSKSPGYAHWGALARLGWGDGGGQLTLEGEYLLLADTGMVPLRGYRGRVRELLGYRVHSRGELPQVLIATTTDERAAAWRALLGEESRRAHLAPLPTHVLTWDDMRQGAVDHSLTTDAATEPPSQQLSKPMPVPVSVADDAPILPLVRGRAGGTPERLSARTRLGELVTRIAPTDRMLVAWVGKHPFLTTAQLSVVTGRSPHRVRRACLTLERLGLLRHLVDGEVTKLRSADAYWESKLEGLELIAAGSGLSLREATELLGLSGGGPEHPLGSRRLLLRVLEHTLGVNGAFVRLYQAAAEFSHRGFDHVVEEWRGAAACAWGRVRPDGYGIYRRGEERYGFYLEWDRGTMGEAGYMRKFRAYLDLRESGRYERDLIGFPTILVVTENRSCELRIDKAVRATCAGVDQLPVLLTTRGRVEADRDGLLGEVWREPGEEMLRYWLRGQRALADVRAARRKPSERKGFRSPYGYFSHRSG
ncbi:MAG: replication-relaxation family protein [Chloroflexota bacterium]|nr:replication-relaxation family protein [Chloroflexota bacterium]